MSSIRGSSLPTIVFLCACSTAPNSSSSGDETGSEAGCAEIEDPEPLDFVEGCWVDPGPRPSCRILSHAVIECGQSEWQWKGIRVAADGERATMLAGSLDSAWLFHASPDAYEVERLPAEFAGSLPLLSQDAEGRLAFALSEGEGSGGTLAARIRFSTHTQDGWTHEEVAVGSLRLRDLELDAAGSPTIWYVDETTGTTQRTTRTSGAWDATDVSAAGLLRRDNLSSQDTMMHYAYSQSGLGGWQLIGYEGDFGEGFGTEVEAATYHQPLPPPRPPVEELDPRGMVVTLRGDGLHLLGSGGYDVTIPGTEPHASTCTQGPLDDCSLGCHELGSGVRRHAFAAARASDGSVWIGWEATQQDVWIEYYEECDDADGRSCACVYAGTRDDLSKHTLHLARVYGEQVEELVSVDILPLESGYLDEDVRRVIDLRAFDDRLAVGLVFESKPAKLGLLEIDIGE